jgi:hypothetical protein
MYFLLFLENFTMCCIRMCILPSLFYFLHANSLQNQNVTMKTKFRRVTVCSAQTEWNIQYSKINNIYVREWQRFCNLLKYFVNLGFASVNNDFAGLQYTLLHFSIFFQ